MNYTSGAVKFYGYDGHFWNEVPGDFLYQKIDLSSKEKILIDLDRLYTTALGKSLINKALNADSLRFVGLALDDTVSGPAFGLNMTGPPRHTTESVQINYNETAHNLYWFNPSGTLVKGDAALSIAHELAHIVYEQNDPLQLPGETAEAFDARQNAANFDFQGAQVRAQNVVARQFNQPDHVRVSYSGAVYGVADVANFTVGVSYTDGAIVDIVRRGGGSDNIIDHSARTDRLRDLLFGEGGDDVINGGGGADVILGGEGNDIIDGGTGRDTIWGDDKFEPNITGNDTINGGDGSDTIYGGGGEDSLRGGSGNDLLGGGDQIDALFGEAGNDLLFGQSGNDVLIGGDGADSLVGGDGSDQLKGGTAADMLYGGVGEDEIEGGDGNDLVFGGGDKDIVSGGAGNDIVYGEAGDDIIQGDAGADRLYGEDGEDSLVGGDGADTLYSGNGDNNGLFGEAGNDTLIFDGGGGVAEGGKGNDIIDARGSSGNVRVFRSAGDGLDTIRASYDIDINSLTYDNVDMILGGARSARGVGAIEFQGQSLNDFKLVWSASAISTQSEDGRSYYVYGGNMRVIDKTTGAAAVDLGYVIGKSQIFAPTFSATYLQFVDIPQLIFDDGRYEDVSEGGDNIELVIAGAGGAPGGNGSPVPSQLSGDASLVAALGQLATDLSPFGADLAFLL